MSVCLSNSENRKSQAHSYICPAPEVSPGHPLVIIFPATSATTAKPLRHHPLSASAQKSWRSRCPVCLANDPCPALLGQGYHPTANDCHVSKQPNPQRQTGWLPHYCGDLASQAPMPSAFDCAWGERGGPETVEGDLEQNVENDALNFGQGLSKLEWPSCWSRCSLLRKSKKMWKFPI